MSEHYTTAPLPAAVVLRNQLWQDYQEQKAQSQAAFWKWFDSRDAADAAREAEDQASPLQLALNCGPYDPTYQLPF